MPDLDALKSQVQSLLTERIGLRGVELTQTGGWSFRIESARVFVDVHEAGDGAIVAIYSPVAVDVPLTPELYEWVALNADNWWFGHLSVRASSQEPGKGFVTMSHNLLGNHLQGPEFEAAILGLGTAAEELDDQIVARFGGRRIHED